MRDIKFRAWLLKENKMVIVDTISNNKGYGGALEIIIDNPLFDPTKKKWEDENRPCDSYLNHSIQVHKDRANGDDFILMQYTGLKDKNGKEIYEGDILKGLFATGGGGNSTKYKEFNFSFSCHISNSSSQFGIDMPKRYGSYRFHPYIHQCEIIGNIYEKPELLK